MSWLDLFRRRAPTARTVTRGEDVAVFAPGTRHAELQMGLGRGGWNSRVFERPDGVFEGLVRNLPVALVVLPGAGLDAEALGREVSRHATLRDVPFLVCGDGPAPAGALRVPRAEVALLLQALDALQ